MSSLKVLGFSLTVAALVLVAGCKSAEETTTPTTPTTTTGSTAGTPGGATGSTAGAPASGNMGSSATTGK